MKSFMAAAALGAAISLGGCGGLFGGPSNEELLTADCIADGESEAACACITKAMKDNLPQEVFAKTAQAVGREKVDPAEFILSLPVNEQMMYGKAVDELLKCRVAASPGG